METIGTVHALLVFAAVYLALALVATINPQIRQSEMSGLECQGGGGT
jgi:hypothetical protein